jgi:hypothetical protein
MEHVTPRHVANGNTPGNGVFYAVLVDTYIMQQYTNCGKLGFLWVRAEVISA